MSEPDARVVVYVTPGCHLCVDACAIVERVCAEVGVGCTEVDLRALDAETAAQWRDFVPVIIVDGEVHDLFRVDADRLRDALGSSTPATRSR